MNNLRSVIYLQLRGYRGSRRRQRGNQKRVLSEQELYPDAIPHEPVEDDFDDVEKWEADFMDAHKSYNEHMREVAMDKEKLKTQITMRKYFKSDDPNFITWTEKMQIKALHEKDKHEWTPERLSESFPALPDTIRKILRANWLPKTADVVLKYDKQVIENWERLKTGSIAVSPRLEAHLQKFKGRKIEIANLETIATKFLKPKPVFPDPKATLFTRIVQGSIQPPKTSEHLPQISDGVNERQIGFSKSTVPQGRRMNFDAFVKATAQKVAGEQNLSIGMKLLMDEYKKKKDEDALEHMTNLKSQTQSVDAANSSESLPKTVEESEEKPKDVTVKTGQTDEKSKIQQTVGESSAVGEATEPEIKVTYVDVPKLNIEDNTLATGIVEWKKKEVCGPDNYPQFIKVPRDKAKWKVTFRVEDRYYDCDGEFLYRVPGLKSHLNNKS